MLGRITADATVTARLTLPTPTPRNQEALVMRRMRSEPQPQGFRPMGPKRPLILGLFAGVLTAQAALLPVFAVVVLVSASDSPFTYNGVEVALGEVRLQVLGMLVLWFAFAAYVGPGLWRGRIGARNVVLAVTLVATIANLVVGAINLRYQGHVGLPLAAGYLLSSALIPAAILVWYLCFKSNVCEFFECRSRSRGAAA